MDKLTLFDKIKEIINTNEIVFDSLSYGKNHYLILDDMRDLINNTFPTLCDISNQGYTDLFDEKKYIDGKDYEEYSYGPVICRVHHKEGYPKGYIDEIKAKDVTYSIVPNSEYLAARGRYDYYYTESENYYTNGLKPHKKINDSVLYIEYCIYYSKDGKIESITTQVRSVTKERNSMYFINDTGFKKFDFKTMEEFLDFKEKVKDFEYAKSLFTTENQKAI